MIVYLPGTATRALYSGIVFQKIAFFVWICILGSERAIWTRITGILCTRPLHSAEGVLGTRRAIDLGVMLRLVRAIIVVVASFRAVFAGRACSALSGAPLALVANETVF